MCFHLYFVNLFRSLEFMFVHGFYLSSIELVPVERIWSEHDFVISYPETRGWFNMTECHVSKITSIFLILFALDMLRNVKWNNRNLIIKIRCGVSEPTLGPGARQLDLTVPPDLVSDTDRGWTLSRIPRINWIYKY